MTETPLSSGIAAPAVSRSVVIRVGMWCAEAIRSCAIGGTMATIAAWPLVRSGTRRIVTGFLLVAWIVVVVMLASAAATRQGTTLLVRVLGFEYSGIQGVSPGQFSFFEQLTSMRERQKLTPSERLGRFLRRYDNPPPVDAVLDELIRRPKWNERNIASLYQGERLSSEAVPVGARSSVVESAEEKWIAQQYDNLFSRVADRL